MQKTFNTQPNLLLSPSDLEHPILHSLDDTEALFDRSKIEALLSSIYAAYSSKQTRDKLEKLGIDDQVQRKGNRNKPLTQADLKRHAQIATTCSTGERPFATYKWHYGLLRTRLMGLAKNTTLYGLAAMASNICFEYS